MITLLCLFSFAVPAGLEGFEEAVYKQASRPLSLYILAPKEAKVSPAIIFFFGGGWNGGTVLQFADQARFFRERGYTAVLVDYRVKSRDGTTVFDAVADAKSAIQWVRAKRRVDRIVAAGGSAGGHLAGATAILSEDKSTRPDALVLFNPVVDTTASGYGAKFIGPRAAELSLTAHIKAKLPRTIIFHGTADTTVPFANVVEFARRMEAAGNRCELVPYKGETHGFFNSPSFRAKNSRATYEAIVERAFQFLKQ